MVLSPLLRSALVLGLLSAVGPFAIDMFLPALPTIANDLGATIGQTQGTITFYFVTFGLSQMVYGPWADQAGRKLPLYVGLVIFAIASVLATRAQSIEMLVAARALQGMGAASLMVVTRAIVRDQYTGYEATKLMGLIMLVFSVSPMLAPLAGAGMIALTGWRAIFAAMAVAAVLAFAITALFQHETLPKSERKPINLATLGRGAKVLLRDPVFMGLTFVGGLGMSGFFIFIASASFVYVETFGLTPTQFSLAFTVNAMGFIGASQTAAPLMRRYGAMRIILTGVIGFAAVMSTLFALSLLGYASFPVIVVGLIAGFASVGLVMPTTMVAALDPHGEIAGLASSLGGTLQMVAGGAMVALTGQFFDGSPTPMLGAMAFCAVLNLALILAVQGRARRALSGDMA